MNRPGSSYGFGYVECDIPAGMTISQWRRQRALNGEPRRPSLAVRASARLRRAVSSMASVVARLDRRATGQRAQF